MGTEGKKFAVDVVVVELLDDDVVTEVEVLVTAIVCTETESCFDLLLS